MAEALVNKISPTSKRTNSLLGLVIQIAGAVEHATEDIH